MAHLKAEIEQKLCELLGEELADENLAEYVVACVSRDCEKDFVESSLAEVIELCREDGAELAKELCSWLYTRLEQLETIEKHKEVVQEQEVKQPTVIASQPAQQKVSKAETQVEHVEQPKKGRAREKIVYSVPSEQPAKPVKVAVPESTRIIKSEIVPSPKKRQSPSSEPSAENRSPVAKAEPARKKARSGSPVPSLQPAKSAPRDKHAKNEHAPRDSVRRGPVAGLFKAALRATTTDAAVGHRDNMQDGPRRNQRHRAVAAAEETSEQQERVVAATTEEKNVQKPRGAANVAGKGSVFQRLSGTTDNAAAPKDVRVERQPVVWKPTKPARQSQSPEKQDTDQPKARTPTANGVNKPTNVPVEQQQQQQPAAQPTEATRKEAVQNQARGSVFSRLQGSATPDVSRPTAASKQNASKAQWPASKENGVQQPIPSARRSAPDAHARPLHPTKLAQDGPHAANGGGVMGSRSSDDTLSADQHNVNKAKQLNATGGAVKRSASSTAEQAASKRAAVSPAAPAAKPQARAAVTPAAQPDDAVDLKRRMLQLQMEIQKLSSGLNMNAPAAKAAPPAASRAPPATSSSAQPAQGKAVVVTNVHFNATPEVVQAHFMLCGVVKSVNIAEDAFGQPKGYAIVEFEQPSEATKALSLSGSFLLGRPIKVIIAKPTAPKPAAVPGAPKPAAMALAPKPAAAHTVPKPAGIPPPTAPKAPAVPPPKAPAIPPPMVPKTPAPQPTGFMPHLMAGGPMLPFHEPPLPLGNPALPPGFGGVSDLDDLPMPSLLKPNISALAAAKPLPGSNVWVRPHRAV